MAENRPRLFQGSRDITLSLIVTGVIMVGAVGLTGMCSYNPGSPEQGQVPEVDVTTFIEMEARGMDFAVRQPEIPDGWVTNSTRRSLIDDTPAPVIGYVTTQGGYIQLTQTGESVDDALVGYDSNPRSLAETYQVEEQDVLLYTSEESDIRDLRIVDLQDSRLLLSGAATAEEFDELITNAIGAQPLPNE